ncbi:MAG TPA: hypothetical protein VKB02_00080 [Pyrinomonadaceae bacterium]|nr:hypothetical protein [Pyrinomonadaceae bacterium]
MRKTNTPVYAVVRIDDYPTDKLENNITIKEIVWSLEEAESEVARLNELNASKGCRYFCLYTRLVVENADLESPESI